MLKEEMEKKLGVKVPMSFYLEANQIYVKGPYRNNCEFCELLKQDKLLMLALRENERLESCKIKKLNEWIGLLSKKEK